MQELTHKFCPECKETLPVSEFHRNRSQPSGFQSYCKICARMFCDAAPSRKKDSESYQRFLAKARERMRTTRQKAKSENQAS